MAEITVSNLTNSELNGTGTFDSLMSAVKTHLLEEFSNNRIRNTDYANVYVGAISTTLQQAIGFELGRQAADKQAELLAAQVIRTDAEIAGIYKQNDLLDKQIIKMDYEIQGLQKDLLVKDAQIIQMGFQNDLLAKQILKMDSEILLEQAKVINMGFQNDLIVQQIAKMAADVDIAYASLVNLEKEGRKIEAEISLMGKQEIKMDSDILIANEMLTKVRKEIEVMTQQVLSAQQEVLKSTAEVALLNKRVVFLDQEAADAHGIASSTIQKNSVEIDFYKQRIITEKAETSNVFTVDGTTYTIYDNTDPAAPIMNGQQGVKYGVIRKQIEGYDRDSEAKVAKVYTDMWSISKNADSTGTTDSIVFGDILSGDDTADLQTTHKHLMGALKKLRDGVGITS